MKKIGIVGLVLIVVAGAGLWLSGKETRVVTTEIEISASPDEVWMVLANIEGWKDWSPIIKDSKGNAALEEKLIITMSGHNGKEGKAGQTYEPVITNFEESKNITWTANMMADFIMTNGKVLELEETSTGTKLVHKETFSGMMVPLMWGMVEQNVPKMLDSMNEALKNVVEDN
ncbi:SRPBCC domain-containing protein [Bacteriovoracaceae bacterium]|nr:SRPBCC domain-containing protein [Bacteriovoracaceae bacterium]